MQINKSYNELGMPTNYSCQGIQDMSFDFDLFTGNLNSRSDNLKELTETFDYDDLDRLTEHTRPFIFNYINTSIEDYSQNYSYFDNGNIKTKSDVSLQNYQYHPTKPHAVVGVNNVINPLASLQEQTISYNSAQDAISISENGYELSFNYGPNNNRVQSILKYQGQVQQTKTYLSNMEAIERDGSLQNVHYIGGGDGLAAVYVEKNGVGNYYFVFKDYLGSILTLADKNGNIVQEQNFDAWGRYRNTEDWTYEDVNPPTLETDGDFSWLRGYTGHEYLPQFSLIHMNGRLYDPLLGRMLSPDNFVHNELGSQGYNRYSYAGNNPLKYIDPDGENPILFAVAVGVLISDYNGRMAGLEGSELLTYNIKGGVISGLSAGVGGLAVNVVSGSLGVGSTLGGAIINGAISGAVGGFTGGFVGGAANAWMVGASFEQGLAAGLKAGAAGGAGGALIGGITGGVRFQKQIGVFRKGLDNLGVEANKAIPATDDFLNQAQKAWYPDAPIDNINKFTVENVPQNHLNSMNKAGAAAKTVPLSVNKVFTGNSNMYFHSTNAFSSAKRLFFAMGHEFVHVSQLAYLAGQSTSVLTPGLIEVLEYHAYSFEYTRLGSSNYGGFTPADVRGLATQYPNYFNSLNYNNFSWTNNFNFYYPF